MRTIINIIGRLLCLCLPLALAGCTDERRAERILEEQGYTSIELTGYSFLSCSEDDVYSTGFKAKAPAGHLVTGTVCCGLLKNCTIRID